MLASLAREADGDELRIGQNEFAQLERDATNRKSREQLVRDLIGECFDEAHASGFGKVADGARDGGVVDGAADVVFERAKAGARPEGDGEGETLWLFALLIGHADAGVNFELLDVNGVG